MNEKHSDSKTIAPKPLYLAAVIHIGLMTLVPMAAFGTLLVREIFWPSSGSHRGADFPFSLFANSGLILIGLLLSWLVYRAVMRGVIAAIELCMVGVSIVGFVSFSGTLIHLGQLVVDGKLTEALAYGRWRIGLSTLTTHLFFGLLLPSCMMWYGRQLSLWSRQIRTAHRQRDVCSACGYDLRGTPSSSVRTCPECGALAVIKQTTSTPK